MKTSKESIIKVVIDACKTCVLATASRNTPHCSLMAYIHDKDTREIFVVTSKKTKKYRNITANANVCLLIDTRMDASPSQVQALTINGVAREIVDRKADDKIRNRMHRSHPHIEAILEDPDSAVIGIKITSAVLLDGPTDAHFFNFEDEIPH